MSKTLAEKYGYFENQQGYELQKVRDKQRRLLWLFPLPSISIYEFKLKDQDPLAFVMPDGTKVQPDRHAAETDMGSIPPALQIFFRKDRFLLSYILHDSGYKNHGMYFKFPCETEYEFMPMSKEEVDAMLHRTIGSERGNWIERNAIHAGVWAGGAKGWSEGSAPAPKVHIKM